MDRFAIFVDAGYFFAAGAHAIAGKKIPRSKISLISPETLVQSLEACGKSQTAIPSMLRIYWYDALLSSRLSLQQTALAHLAGLKLRLGSVNNAGEQKGVDSLIVTDLIELARNKAITDAILVSGDEDLRIAVQLAQSFGVRIHLLAVDDASRNMSLALKMEADSLTELDVNWLKEHITITDDQTAPLSAANSKEKTPSSSPTSTISDIAPSVFNELQQLDAATIEKLLKHFESSTTVPPEYDRPIIAVFAKKMGRRLSPEEMRKIRGMFVNFVRAKKDASRN